MREARPILGALLDYFESAPRTGSQGYGFADTHVHMLMGQHDRALQAFEAAVDDGVRTTWFSERWPRPQYDPVLNPLGNDPRFQAAVARMQDDLAKQRASLLE